MSTSSLKLPARLQSKLEKRKRRASSGKHQDLPSQEDVEDEDEDAVDSSGLLWRPVPRSNINSGFEDAAVLQFEEIDDVDVQYEDVPGGGRVVKLVVRCTLSLHWPT